ncbi:MAG: hypothetical protein V7K26_30205 [Nostoc sp.]|uniref:hypothetical protein n=1 Tax=Nostoc sp. TaxID=1180 RepID=UPI002FF0295D
MPTESQENCDIAKFLLFELAKRFLITLLAYKDIEVEVSGRRATCRLPDLVLHTESKVALIGSPRNLITRDMPPPWWLKSSAPELRTAAAITVTSARNTQLEALLNTGLSILS